MHAAVRKTAAGALPPDGPAEQQEQQQQLQQQRHYPSCAMTTPTTPTHARHEGGLTGLAAAALSGELMAELGRDQQQQHPKRPFSPAGGGGHGAAGAAGTTTHPQHYRQMHFAGNIGGGGGGGIGGSGSGGGGGGGISAEELLDLQRVLTGGVAVNGPLLRTSAGQENHQQQQQQQLQRQQHQQQPRHRHHHQHHQHQRSRDRDFSGVVKPAHRPPPPHRARTPWAAAVAAVAGADSPTAAGAVAVAGVRRAASSPPSSSSPPPQQSARVDGGDTSASASACTGGRSSRSGSGASTSTSMTTDATTDTTTTTTTTAMTTGTRPTRPTTGDSNPPLSLWGPDPVPLPPRFARIKRNLIAGHEADLEASWARLLAALRDEVEHIECLGAHLVPSVEFADLDDPAQTARFGRDLRRYGVGVVRKVLPRRDADDAVRDTVRYLDTRRRPAAPGPFVVGGGGGGGGHSGHGGRERGQQQQQPSSDASHAHAHTHAQAPGGHGGHFRAPRQDPTCFDCFWTPAQIRARAHPNVRRAQRFMMGLWEPDAQDRIAPHLPITYADRIRLHGGGFDADPGGTGTPPLSSSSTPAGAGAVDGQQQQQQQQQAQFLAPQSADDWINALQSSAGIIAQVDNGSLERWEPDGYGRGGAYDHVFAGRWEEHDPWAGAGQRASSTTDLYNGYGACTVFRMFQGLLALSTIEPGTLRLMPSPRLATAYYLLRPFFAPRTPPPPPADEDDGRRQRRHDGPAWDAYLDASNWELLREPDTTIHGAVPGHAQRVTERWHPHLCLRSSLVTLPTLQPGDYIFWHPDLPYHISSSNGGQSSTSMAAAAPGATTTTTPTASSAPGAGLGGGGGDDVRMLVYIPAAPLTQTGALYLARQRRAFQRGNPGPDFDSSGRGVVAEDPELRPGEAEMERVGGKEALRAMGLLPWEVEEEDVAPQGGGAGGGKSDNELVRLANLILFPE